MNIKLSPYVLKELGKIKKTDKKLSIELILNPDILMTVSSFSEPPFCVGFAAETEDLEKNAEIKRRKKNLPLLVANLAQDAIGSDESALILLDDAGKHVLVAKPMCLTLREADEEIGLPPNRVLRLGELDEVATPSGFRIVPCVGAIPFPFDLKPNPGEIDETFAAPLGELAHGLGQARAGRPLTSGRRPRRRRPSSSRPTRTVRAGPDRNR